MPQSPDCQWVLPVGQGASGRHLGLDTLVSVSMGAKAARDRTSTWQTDTNCTRSSLCWGPNHITPNHYAFHATSSVTKWHEVAKLISTQIALLCGLSLKQAVELKRCRCLGRNCEIRRWRCFREDLPQTTYLLTHFNVLQHRGNNFFWIFGTIMFGSYLLEKQQQLPPLPQKHVKSLNWCLDHCLGEKQGHAEARWILEAQRHSIKHFFFSEGAEDGKNNLPDRKPCS